MDYFLRLPTEITSKGRRRARVRWRNWDYLLGLGEYMLRLAETHEVNLSPLSGESPLVIKRKRKEEGKNPPIHETVISRNARYRTRSSHATCTRPPPCCHGSRRKGGFPDICMVRDTEKYNQYLVPRQGSDWTIPYECCIIRYLDEYHGGGVANR